MLKSDPLVPLERYIQRTLSRLPQPISRWFGYRAPGNPPATATWVVCLWGFIGAFSGLSVLLAIFGHVEYFEKKAVPPIIASFGASAILSYNTIAAPLAQPRSLIFGHFFSGLVGRIVATIFAFNLHSDPHPKYQWLAAALATAIALVVMHLTKTTHPPAGATALLPCVDAAIWGLKWYYLPVLLLSSMVVLVTACGINNVQRAYPKFWVAEIPPSSSAPLAQKPAEAVKKERESASASASEQGESKDVVGEEGEGDSSVHKTHSGASRDLERAVSS